ncbi:molybdopterin-dependent oxidoreductase [Nakamurella endophytica]|uniref:Oxidoreductase n=1 Tax=Nakamurella endophytica TaxID=1748367 RepID=A0A917T2T8_9ACTN|nr:molybdopterin-dependent oxidoreductase [Nakamurella endophytica]GGM08850.1 oxidoreductase [Nakamurella endophytica]
MTTAPAAGRTRRRDDTGRPWLPGRWAAAAVGLVAVGVTIGLAELLSALGVWAGVLHAASSPVTALGGAFIQLTPEWLKEFAIRQFGQHDKDALRVGMGLTLVLVALLVGLVARRSPRTALALTGALVAVALAAVWTRTGTGPADGVPVLLGGAAGAVLLVLAFRRTVPASGPGAAGAAEQVAAEVSPRPGSAPVAARAAGTDRRHFFRVAGVGVVAAAAAGALARWVPSSAAVADSRARFRVPAPADAQTVPAGTSLGVEGQQPWITPTTDFYRVDTAFAVPSLTTDAWRLQVHGMVERPLELSFDDLLAREQIQRTITLTCVSNEVGGDLVGNATWVGARIDDLLAEVRPAAGADCVLCTSVDGFTLTAPLSALTDGRDALLAVGMNGEPLPVEHGFPVRMVVPGLYGYVSACKWVVDMKVSTFAAETAYWTARGWAPQGPIRLSSRIDVPRGFAQYRAGEQIVLAGVAWAQQHGIRAVQLQVDDGPWRDAELGAVPSEDTWVQWRWAWTATPGLHTVRVRAVDRDGTVQDEAVRPPFPSGSTGYDSRSITVS